ncbi:unnamed protein product, partial [Adineta steineri]
LPPPLGSKKEAPKLRSNNNIVIPPANTGKLKTNKNLVTIIAQTNKVKNSNLITYLILPFIQVVIKLIPPKIEDTPATYKGGYTVQPVPGPNPTNKLKAINNNATGTNQNLKLFKRGNAISIAFIIKGSNQFPKPPTATGITKKKIIKNA